ncbi:MAG: metallophosphoesterase family protein [Gammaproteobacteria bacterium]
MRVGLISDTHGLMRPEALTALEGVSHIVHAGDIGSAAILAQLRTIAPVTAVRGNNDKEAWASGIAEHEVVEIGGKSIYVLHDLKELDLDPTASGFSVVVTGHSHKPVIATRDDVLYVNPGSAGPRRFKLPISVAVLEIVGDAVRAEIRELSL